MGDSSGAPAGSRSIRIADSDPLSGLHRPANNARGQSNTSSLASSVVGGGSVEQSVLLSAPIIDATQINSSSISQQQQQNNRTQSSSLGAPRIEGMDQLEKSVMDDGSDNDFKGNYANMTDAEKRMKEEELSFYSASDNDHGDDNIWGLLSGVGGNIYEWYVLYVYSSLG